jgi:hypothetical protein
MKNNFIIKIATVQVSYLSAYGAQLPTLLKNIILLSNAPGSFAWRHSFHPWLLHPCLLTAGALYLPEPPKAPIEVAG